MNFVLKEMSAYAALRAGKWRLGDLYVTTLDANDLSKCSISMLPGDSLSLIFVKAGFLALKSALGSQRLNTGSLFVSDPLTVYEHADFGSQTKLISISIPRRLLLERGFATRSFELIAANMMHPDARAVGDLIVSIVEQNGGTSLALRERQGRHLLELIATLMGNPLAVASPDKREAALSRVREYVAQHLEDCDLNTSRIATSVGISTSHLNRLFKARSTTVMRYVLSCRLDRAADLLRTRGRSKVSIGDIAYSCGFASHAHFSRVFKGRFGVSPSDYKLRVSVPESGTPSALADGPNHD
jgi:AraC-like DNA-binding protein